MSLVLHYRRHSIAPSCEMHRRCRPTSRSAADNLQSLHHHAPSSHNGLLLRSHASTPSPKAIDCSLALTDSRCAVNGQSSSRNWRVVAVVSRSPPFLSLLACYDVVKLDSPRAAASAPKHCLLRRTSARYHSSLDFAAIMSAWHSAATMALHRRRLLRRRPYCSLDRSAMAPALHYRFTLCSPAAYQLLDCEIAVTSALCRRRST